MPLDGLRKKMVGLWVALGSATLAVGAVPGSADAAMLGLNDSVSVNWLLASGDADQNGNTNPYSQDITVEAIFKVTSFNQSAGEVDLWVSISNTTADEGHEVGVHKLGLGVDPTLTGVSGLIDEGSTGDTDAFESIELGTSAELVHSGAIDLLAVTERPGAPWRLQEGQTDIFSFTMFFEPASLGSTIDLDPFDIKILANPASFQLTSTNGRIPLPATLWLLGAGLIGLGILGRLRRQ